MRRTLAESRTIYLADLSFLGGISNLETLLALLPPVTTITPERAGIIPESQKPSNSSPSWKRNTPAPGPFYDMLLYGAHRAVGLLQGRYAISPLPPWANTLGPPQSAKYAERFLYVCNYINEHCTEDLSLETIAGIAGFSKYHFTRLFKDFTHTSFYRYLNKKRNFARRAAFNQPGILRNRGSAPVGILQSFSLHPHV